MDLHTWITQQVDAVERSIEDDCIPSDEAAPILRRCEADRRILARHHHNPDCLAWAACKGCGNDDWGLPNVDDLNDCPELLDLARAHGLTEEILAGLDRPQPSDQEPVFGTRLGLSDILATRPITTSDVPEALRGPRWKPGR